MAKIVFNAFSFLQEKLKQKNRGYCNVDMEVSAGTTAADLIKEVGLEPKDVEGVFINGKIGPLDSVLEDGDRVAMVPPGTPGPYRMMLGMIKRT